MTYILYRLFLYTINWLRSVWGSCITKLLFDRYESELNFLNKFYWRPCTARNVIKICSTVSGRNRWTDEWQIRLPTHEFVLCICRKELRNACLPFSKVKLPSRIFAKWNCRLQNITLHLPKPKHYPWPSDASRHVSTKRPLDLRNGGVCVWR
jgi:hypothetical protein